MFFINIAAAGRQINDLRHVDDAIALATAALPHSVNLNVAEAALAQLKANLTARPANHEPVPVDPAEEPPEDSETPE
jgi:hypothetical protein